jgi:hypothetical protein
MVCLWVQSAGFCTKARQFYLISVIPGVPSTEVALLYQLKVKYIQWLAQAVNNLLTTPPPQAVTTYSPE